MNSNIKVVLSIVIALVMIVSSLLVVISTNTAPTPSTNISNNLVKVASAAKPSTSGSNLPSNATVSVFLNFKSGINSYAQDVQTVGSSFFRQYLTPQQIGLIFGVQGYSQIVSYFESYGLNVQTYPDQINLNVVGNPYQIEAAFHTTLQPETYNAPGGNATVIYVSTSPVYLPTYISNVLNGIIGLDGSIVPNQLVQYDVNQTALSQSDAFNTIDPTITSNQATNINYGNFTWAPFGGSFGNFQFLYPSTLPYVVGANNLWKGLDTIASEPDQGQGITIAVTEVGCVPLSVISSYGQQVFNNPYQVLNRFTQIGVDIPTYTACLQDGRAWGWTGETELDIEYIAAMAPQAHIVLVGGPNDQVAGFDPVYAAITNYLSSGTQCNLPSYITIFNGPSSGACSISITSNSHGFYSTETQFSAAPFDVLVQENLVNEMAAHGVTEFFATGDGAGTDSGSILQTGRPSESTQVVSVGGGQITTQYDGTPFPNTGVFTRTGRYITEVAPAQGLYSYTYWYCGGQCGGSYGSSTMWQQPWYQNGLDIYSSGTEIEPTVSNVASFNLTIWGGEGWGTFIGGTSFATPITAGEWALVEEQAVVAGLTPYMGNINPLLYELHNAQQAGAISQDAFAPMTNIGQGWDWSPFASYDWMQLNTTQMYPQDQNVPWWFTTLFNPAGVGWSYLGGFGLTLVDIASQEVVGQLAQDSLLVPNLIVQEVTSSGLQPVTTLTGGQSYNFEVLTPTGGVTSDLTITAYSGGAGNGVYGGGTRTTITTTDGQFSYTPVYAAQYINANASEYGYFLVNVSGTHSISTQTVFQQFGVVEPDATGTLTLGVETPYGLQTSVAEVTAFNDLNIQDTYTLGQLGVVELNGAPITNALVQQIAINVSYIVYSGDPFVYPSQFAPGVTIGQYLTDTSGQFYYWTNPLDSANSGPVYTQVFELVATYAGLTSNPVIVYVEPQAGFYTNDLSLNAAGTAIVGNVYFHDMKYLNSLNVSIGSSPGQYATETFAANTTFNGVFSVDLSPLPSGPISVTLFAQGQNTINLPYSFYLTSIGGSIYSRDIIWNDPLLFLPATLTSSVNSQNVVGNDTFTFTGTQYQGAQGVLQLVSGNGTATTLTTGISGSYTLNTASLLDGWYTVTYTETAPGASTVKSITIYSYNQAASDSALIAKLNGELSIDAANIQALQTQMLTLNGTIASLQSSISTLKNDLNVDNVTISSLKSELSSANATISTLNTQISSLNTQISSLQGQVSALEAEISSLKESSSSANATIVNLQAELSADNATIASDQATINSDNSIMAKDTNQINNLSATINTLQNELNSKKAYVPNTYWYTYDGGALAVIIGFVIGVIIAGGAAFILNRTKKTQKQDNSTSHDSKDSTDESAN